MWYLFKERKTDQLSLTESLETDSHINGGLKHDGGDITSP